MSSIILKQIKFHLIFWPFLLVALIPLFFVIVAQLFNLEKTYKFITSITIRTWGKISIFATGSKVEIIGKENIPKNKKVCYVCNHQSNFDIPTILSVVNHEIGFVAKESLIFFPIVGLWMKFMGCIFINRSNLKESIRSINKELQTIVNGRPIVVFPEGTRSKSNNLGEFQPGTLKMLAKIENIEIIPLTLVNTYQTFEEKGLVNNAEIKLFVHPPIKTIDLNKEEAKNIAETLKSVIEAPLKEIALKN